MNTLTITIVAAVSATVVSILLAAAVSLGPLSKVVDRLVSFSAGMLLGTALLHLLPESVHMGGEIHGVSVALLAGLVGFFILERLAILRHDHHHGLYDRRHFRSVDRALWRVRHRRQGLSARRGRVLAWHRPDRP